MHLRRRAWMLVKRPSHLPEGRGDVERLLLVHVPKLRKVPRRVKRLQFLDGRGGGDLERQKYKAEGGPEKGGAVGRTRGSGEAAGTRRHGAATTQRACSVRVLRRNDALGRHGMLCSEEQHANQVIVASDDPSAHRRSHSAQRLHQWRLGRRVHRGLHHARTCVDEEQDAVLLVKGWFLRARPVRHASSKDASRHLSPSSSNPARAAIDRRRGGVFRHLLFRLIQVLVNLVAERLVHGMAGRRRACAPKMAKRRLARIRFCQIPNLRRWEFRCCYPDRRRI